MTNNYFDANILYPWAAHTAPVEPVAISQAAGRTAASTLRQYPPGIPDVIPGMTYTDDIADVLNAAAAANVQVIGMNEDTRTVDVVAEGRTGSEGPDIITSDSREIDTALATEIADFFRLQFSAGPYHHFAFYEGDPLQSLPRNLDFAAYAVSTALSDKAKRLACQHTLRDLAYREAISGGNRVCADSPTLPKGFRHWTDKSICREQIKDRLSDPGYITLVRDRKTNRLTGLLHARQATVERLFRSEEWQNPHIFSAFDDEGLHADASDFFSKIEYHFGLKPADPVMTISAQILTPEAQGGDVFYKMMRSMAQRVSPEHVRLPLLCEIPPFGTAHRLNRAFTDRIIFGVLKNEHPLVFCKQTSQALFPFISEKYHWHAALRNSVRDNRRYRSNYYIPLPNDNASVAVKPNGKLGLAVFAAADIPKGATIAVFTGETYRSETALGLPEIMRDHAIQIGATEYVFGYKGLAHRLCHSCDPNCGIRNLTEIFAVRDIAPGEQITWDYRCSENSDWVLETCLCGTDRCTGSVGNFEGLPKNIKAEYLAKGMVSEWLVPETC